MIVVYQGNCTMIAKPGITIGISDDHNKAIMRNQIEEALRNNDAATYNLLTENEKDSDPIELPDYKPEEEKNE